MLEGKGVARLGHVPRARITQIMSLLNLASDIIEEVLFLQRTIKGRDPISVREVLELGTITDWDEQREKNFDTMKIRSTS